MGALLSTVSVYCIVKIMKQNAYAKPHTGFTLVELLIVIVVIAILATVSIIAYQGIQVRAKESAIRSDLSNFSRLVELYHIDNDRYPSPGSSAELASLSFKVTQQAYPADIDYNFDYCTDRLSGNTKYILTVKLNSKEAIYVSSKNSSPKKYKSDNGFPDDSISRSSPCYNDVVGSAADHAGLSGILRTESPEVPFGVSGKSLLEWKAWVK